MLPQGLYYIEVQQLGSDYISVAHDETANGYILVSQSDGTLHTQYGSGYAAVRANFGQNPRLSVADMEARQLLSPSFSQGLFYANEKIEAVIANNSHIPQNGVVIACAIDKTVLYDTIDFEAYQENTVSFIGDLSVPGIHPISVYAQLPDDENPHNDTVSINITCDEPLDPYSLDFESCNDFMMDHFNPQWISVNEDDNEHNYGLSGYEWPNAYAAGAFIAFNPSQATPSLEDVADPHAGNKFGASFSSPEGASNDWLISPKLSMPDNARLRLWTKSFKANEYTERFNILISTTDNSPESFIQIGQTHQAGADWEETVVDLTQIGH